MNILSSLLMWIGRQFISVDEAFSITRRAGNTLNTDSTVFSRNGKIVSATLVINASTTEIPAGSNIFEGTLNTVKLRPAAGARLVGYIGQRAIVCGMSSDGNIIIRNTSPSGLVVAGTLYLSGTYVIN